MTLTSSHSTEWGSLSVASSVRLALLPAQHNVSYWGGDGTPTHPYPVGIVLCVCMHLCTNLYHNAFAQVPVHACC